MIRRKLNKPTYKVRAYPMFWVQEFRSSEWFCRDCGITQKPGSVAFEIIVRYARKGVAGQEDVDKPVRLYLCMHCAEKMLETVLQKVQLIKAQGANGFRMFEEV